MIKKIVLLLTLGSILGWVASCAWKAPLQEINIPDITYTLQTE